MLPKSLTKSMTASRIKKPEQRRYKLVTVTAVTFIEESSCLYTFKTPI